MTAYEYGRTWSKLVPRFHINWLINQYHVGTADTEIIADIRERCLNAPKPASPTIQQQCIDYAIDCHKTNQNLYQQVMR